MCVPKAKNSPPNVDLKRAIANKTKNCHPKCGRDYPTTAHIQMKPPVPDSLFSGFVH
jgi:hypothetical protein